MSFLLLFLSALLEINWFHWYFMFIKESAFCFNGFSITSVFSFINIYFYLYHILWCSVILHFVISYYYYLLTIITYLLSYLLLLTYYLDHLVSFHFDYYIFQFHNFHMGPLFKLYLFAIIFYFLIWLKTIMCLTILWWLFKVLLDDSSIWITSMLGVIWFSYLIGVVFFLFLRITGDFSIA